MATRNNKPAVRRAKLEAARQREVHRRRAKSLGRRTGQVHAGENRLPPLTPERQAARQLLNDEEREMLEAMERELVRPLTEQEQHVVLEAGPLIEQPPAK